MRARRLGLTTLLAALALAPAAHAATFTVNATTEGVDANVGDGTCETSTPGQCTLRAALQEAEAANPNALQTVVLHGGTYTTTSKLPFDHKIALQGDGSATTTITGNNHQLIDTLANATDVRLSGVTLNGGGSSSGSAAYFHSSQLTNVALDGVRVTNSDSNGPRRRRCAAVGAVSAAGMTFTVANSTIDGNSDGGNGLTGSGVVYVTATTNQVVATVSNLKLVGNTVGGGGAGGTANGGAIHWDPASGTGSRLVVQGSTIADNQAGDSTATGSGAAINSSATGNNVSVNNSTLSGNAIGVNGVGSAIYYAENNNGTLSITDSTIANNRAPFGGGNGVIANASANSRVNIYEATIAGNTSTSAGSFAGLVRGAPNTVDVNRTVLANNLADGSADNCSATVGTSGWDLADTPNSDCGLTSTGASGIQQAVPAKLGPLQDNGGPAFTMAPLAGSTLIDANTGSCNAMDQRGAPRPSGAACDIGAFESDPPGSDTASASAPSDTSVTLAGVVNGGFGPASWHFEYGPTAAYGASSAGGAFTGDTLAHNVSEVVSGLLPGTTYHYRAVVTNVSGASASGDQTFTTAPASAPPGGGGPTGPSGPTGPTGSTGPTGLVPTRGVGIVIGRSTGTVLFRRRGSKRFHHLTMKTIIAPGSEISTLKGTVELTSAKDAAGTPQTAIFRGGEFVVTQSKTSALTVLALSGHELRVCGHIPTFRVTHAATLSPLARKKIRRTLFGSGHGSFQTKGAYGVATVRGTIWRVSDSCDATKVTVSRGIVDVRDLVKRKTVKVKAHHSYTARRAKARARFERRQARRRYDRPAMGFRRVVATVFAALVLPAAVALAAPGADIRGKWSCVNSAGGTCEFTIDTLDPATGAFSGSGAGNGSTWTVTGTLDGLSLTMRHTYDSGGVFDFTGKVNSAGSRMQGTFKGPANGSFDYPRVDPPSAPEPAIGATLVLGRVSGTIRYRAPGAKRFLTLGKDQAVPTGSEIDAKRGVVELTSANRATIDQTARFNGGLFTASQSPSSALTTAALTEPLACTRAARTAKTTRRRLFGSGKGSFRTLGRYGSATVRGTRWTVTDTCAATTLKVTEGTVAFRDFVKRKTVSVTAGHSYSARRAVKR